MEFEELLRACEYIPGRKKIAAIDIGITNMGLVTAMVEGTSVSVEVCELVDIKLLSDNCCDARCKLSHESTVLDWVAHFNSKFGKEIESCDVILIEKQPPGGIQHVEALLIKEYRRKVVMIYPVALHKYMNVTGLDYDLRKEKMESRAKSYLSGFETWKTSSRKHDVADALCFILYYINTLPLRDPPPPIYDVNVEPIENFRFKSGDIVKNEFE